MKKIISLLLLLLPVFVFAQMNEPVKWTANLNVEGDSATLTLTCNIDAGWHLYATELPPIDFGPAPTSVTYSNTSGLEAVGALTPSVAPIEIYEETFEADVRYWENSVTLTQKFAVNGEVTLAGQVEFQACNDQNCIPPSTFEFSFGQAEEAAAPPVSGGTFNPADLQWWTPVEGVSAGGDVANASLWSIFLWGFLGGLLALFTPCVWPMIPLTVSFFLKKNSDKKKSVRDAVIYGGSIIIIYLILGLAVTLIFGASKLNDLSTNAVFNLIFFALLVVFAVSFFGAFDIKLPARWSNAMDSKAENATGLLSIFFMAFTLALVSFSCTGPIIGTLLVEAATMGNIVGPAVGMGAFALALAIPFALFALFPSMLKSVPRSGGWLNSVKVVLGFLELALSLKFLSVADLAYGWHLLDREVFVSLWVVIFALLGLYLLGKIRFPHDSPCESTGVGRFFLALASLSFSIYLLPGLWGAPLKGVSAFVPPLFTQDFNLYTHGEHRTFSDYEEGMRYAAENNMPVLMDFSGYGCVNCRKMEGAVFDTDEISEVLGQNFVIIELMVDDKKPLAQPLTVEENGKTKTLRTVGDKWSFLQRYKFASNSQPYYVVLDNEGNALSGSYSYDEDVAKFKTFLDDALTAYQN
ncbi:MAG: thioredoxin family protein [Bacteroides sp.]|nr:thioredoxin family protein [Bacteroides sp.]MCM1379329.1 thioredoxin family protein [Bacteroides sp.]MCM1445012.1 thioredoxin family protein [Prevotella sp.]